MKTNKNVAINFGKMKALGKSSFSAKGLNNSIC